MDNHITVYPSFYRGRAVTEANIQDYISNIVSKYLPPDLPPWQICVIPLSNASRSEDVTASTSAASETVASESFEEQQSESSVSLFHRFHFNKILSFVERFYVCV